MEGPIDLPGFHFPVGLFSDPWFALGIAVAMTALAFIESSWVRWSPFFIGYACLCLIIPICAGNLPLGISGLPAGTWGGVAVFVAAISAWDAGVMGLGFERIWLGRYGKAGDPGYNPTLALICVFEKARKRFGWNEQVSTKIFALLAFVWAPIGEELFYWGFLYRTWSGEFGVPAAMALTSISFGLRHSGSYLYLRPVTPFPAAAVAGLSAGISALLNSFLFEYTESLLVLIAVHLATNLIVLRIPRGPR